MRAVCPALIIFAALLSGVAGPSLADVGTGLYVSENGADTGLCTNVATPCRTIGYALQVAGKNTRIHVAEGTFRFDDPEAIIYAATGAVYLHGGYRIHDDGEWSDGGVSFLTGVPPGYRDFFAGHGFTVLADSKGDYDPDEAAAMLQQHQSAQQSAAAADCVGGVAQGFSCNAIDLLAHVARPDFSSSPMKVADIWGFVDLNTYREYVIVGLGNGTSVFDVSDPQNPVEVGFVPGQVTTWRDIKIYQWFDETSARWRAAAYVSADGSTDGIVVIDLSDLPHGIRRVSYASDILNAHNVYLTDIDYATGLAPGGVSPQLIVAGSNSDNGQFRTYSLDQPTAPRFIQRVAGAGYMHDATSLRIDDLRMGQCPNATTSCNVLVDFNEENVELWDITNAAAPAQLSVLPQWANRGYVHSGWWTEDRRYVLVHDELDERNTPHNTKLRVMSMDSLVAPSIAGEWNGPTRAIDHNGFVRGNRYYMSNYTRGLTILDLSNPTAPVEAGFFDTYGASNFPEFAGAWGVYPFLPSGTVAVSDINSGLYLFRDATRDVPAGRLAFAAASYSAEEGGTATLVIERAGGSTGTVGVSIEAVGVSANGDDFTLTSNDPAPWNAGDTSTRSVPVTVTADGVGEDIEHVIVRLVDPTGGATLGDINVAHLYLSDPGAPTELALRESAVEVAEGGAGIAVVTLHRRGSASGAVSVDYAVTAIDAAAGADFDGPAGGTLAWSDGDASPRSIQFSIIDDGTGEDTESFSIDLSNASGATLSGPSSATVRIFDGDVVNNPPQAVAGGNQSRTEGSPVTLDGSASTDPDGDPLTFAWTQTAGPMVSLSGGTSATPGFTAPQVSASQTLTFQLTVTDPGGLSDSATVSVTVTNSTSRQPGGSGGGPAGDLALAALLLLGLRAIARYRHVSRRDCAE